MATVVCGMYYTIFFKDPIETQFAIAVAGGNYLTMAPRDAALLFGIPHPYPTDYTTAQRGIYFTSPFIPGTDIPYPLASGILSDDSVLSTLVPAQISATGTFGPDGLFTWMGRIVCLNAQAGIIYANLPKRRFAIGFEAQGNQEVNGSTLGTKSVSRDAARIANGFGFAVRKPGVALNWQAILNTVVSPLNQWHTWERFYFRLRNANPGNDTYIYFAAGGTTPSQMQARLRADGAGTLSLINYNGVSNTVIGTTPQLVLEQWYKIDILIDWNDAAVSGSGRLRLYVNGTIYADAFVTVGVGANNPGTGHTYSRLGVGTEGNIGLFNAIDCDFDDWVNSEIPAIGGFEALTSYDWFMGSHIREHYVTADGPGRANWGALPAMVGNQQRNDNTTFSTAANAFTTVTGLALLDLITDISELQELYGISFGITSVLVTTNTIDADLGATGQLGYAINGVATLFSITDTTITQHWAQYSAYPTQLLPASIIPFNVQRKKANTVNQVQALGLYCYAEYLGIFNAEDDTSGSTVSPPKYTHNSPYFNTADAYSNLQSASPVFMYGATYVGNGTQQEIALPCPLHFMWIRATGGVGVTPVSWFSWQWGGHRHAQVGSQDYEPIRICFDPVSLVYKLTIAASGTSFLNNAGTTYQLIGFSDVGMRYMINDAVAHQASAVTKTGNIIDTFFTPTAGFFGYELAATTVVNNLWYRGPGNSTNDANALNATGTQANIGSFLTGQFTIDTALNTLAVTKGYSAWRHFDSCTQCVWQAHTYTGNGSSPRVITLPLTSGRFPLFAMVSPHNGVAWYRDPSHAGGNSSQYGASTDSINGITAGGIDQITVGSSLNANGIVYEVFVIMGSPVSWANGLFWPGNCFGGGSTFINPPEPPPAVNIFAQGGIELGDSTGLTLLKDISGIYTLVPGKRNDTLIDRQTGQTSVDTEIPDPTFKTGYVGG